MTQPYDDRYDDAARERLVVEPPKRVDAPVRQPFERDRARVVHAAASRRLAAKTQVVGPQTDDFVRNRLTHSLEVAQVARDLARALGCDPDLAETAALAHDLGHPPFGHNGERALAEHAVDCGGFEGNAQTLRLLTRLEAKTFDADGHSVGLNLTRATLDACTKYPWTRDLAEAPQGVHGDGSPRVVVKFGVYDDDRPVFDWLRRGIRASGSASRRRSWTSPTTSPTPCTTSRTASSPARSTSPCSTARRCGSGSAAGTSRTRPTPSSTTCSTGMRRQGSWPTAPYDGSRRAMAALKNLTSDLIGRFCGAVQEATFAAGDGPFVRYDARLQVPARTRLEIGVLKGIAAHYVMSTDDRVALMVRQRDLLAELVETLLGRGPDALDRPFADDWHAAADDAARRRVVIDQVASLGDASAVARHSALA